MLGEHGLRRHVGWSAGAHLVALDGARRCSRGDRRRHPGPVGARGVWPRARAGAVAVDVVADAAHPLAAPALYRRVVDTVLAGADAAIPGLPLAEVVKEITTTETATMGTVVEAGRSLLRETHRLIQMPHAFAAGWLRDAHASATNEAVEDSEMVAAAGARVIVVDGEPANIHVTTPEELALANLMAPAVLHAERSRHGRGTHARRGPIHRDP